VSITTPKIILHSDQSVALTAGRDQELIRSLSGKRSPRIGYIPSTPDRRRKYFAEKDAYYQKIGFSGLQYFDPAEGASEEEISSFFSLDVIHLAGGEVVPFMNSLRNSGCDARLKAFAARGGLLLGLSAGAMLLGKTFASASLFGEKGVFDGMGFFDFEVVPHVSENFPRLDILRDFAKRQKKTVYALNDGDVVVISGAKIRTYGSVTKID
jgi:dipeptidase E